MFLPTPHDVEHLLVTGQHTESILGPASGQVCPLQCHLIVGGGGGISALPECGNGGLFGVMRCFLRVPGAGEMVGEDLGCLVVLSCQSFPQLLVQGLSLACRDLQLGNPPGLLVAKAVAPVALLEDALAGERRQVLEELRARHRTGGQSGLGVGLQPEDGEHVEDMTLSRCKRAKPSTDYVVDAFRKRKLGVQVGFAAGHGCHLMLVHGSQRLENEQGASSGLLVELSCQLIRHFRVRAQSD